MYISETFVSLQGEGLLAGAPSFFIRSSGCPLRCSWCDTRYASWEPEGTQRSVSSLVAEACSTGIQRVVLTGGEPLVQKDVALLTRALRAEGLHLTIETAAVVAPDDVECDLLSASPKTSSSDPAGSRRERHRKLRQDLQPLATLLTRSPQYQLKLVVRQRSDIEDILDVLMTLDRILEDAAGSGPASRVDRDRVLLMAEGRDAAEVATRASLVASLCLDHGFRYTPRLHLDLFGGGRGV